ncbi:MAG: hypothetical protein WBV22_08815 [Anaerolineaceae bacterium]
MKKAILGFTLIATLVLALGLTSLVSAQSSEPTPTPERCSWFEKIFDREDCVMGRPDGSRINDGILHDYMVNALAEKLSISVTTLEERFNNGESMSQIAVAEGLSFDEFQTWMLDARTQAIDQAVKDGKLTTEQADWMKSHRGAMMFGGFSRQGGMMFGGSGRSDRSGRFGDQICPMYR